MANLRKSERILSANRNPHSKYYVLQKEEKKNLDTENRQKDSAITMTFVTGTGTAEDDDATNAKRLRLCKLLTLVCLCFTDGTYTLIRRYSVGVRKETYNVKEVLLVSEFFKLLFSTYMVSRNVAARNKQQPQSTSTTTIPRYLIELIFNSRKMLILAGIYGVMNILSYYALARVGAGTFVVFSQGKALTTAVFSALIMNRRFSWTQIRALLTLVGGVILFVLPTLEQQNNHHHPGGYPSGTFSPEAIKGCLAHFVTIALSGFASVYFEKAIKNDKSCSEGLDIWARNVQLGFHSIIIYLLLLNTTTTGGGGMAAAAAAANPGPPFGDNDDTATTRKIFFANWTPLAVILSMMGAYGGLLVALCIKYGDSVLKTLATSGGILYASIFDRFLLGGPLTGQMSVSATIVVLAIISYTFDATPTKSIHSYDVAGKGCASCDIVNRNQQEMTVTRTVTTTTTNTRVNTEDDEEMATPLLPDQDEMDVTADNCRTRVGVNKSLSAPSVLRSNSE